MASKWTRFQSLPRRFRWPIKGCVFVVVLFFVLYPYPHLFVRNVRHLRSLDALPDPNHPALAEVSQRLDVYLGQAEIDPATPRAMLAAVDAFVCREIPYQWDWEVWGVMDYVPTVGEVLARGHEDCDGRAVLAAALLRARGIDARLVGDPRHMWVHTPQGDTMSPLGTPVFRADDRGLDIDWGRLLDTRPLAFGIAVFPFGRELVVLLTILILLLPDRPSGSRAALAALMLLGGLIVLRLAGRIHGLEITDGPSRILTSGSHLWVVLWGMSHGVAAVLLVRKKRATKT